MIRKILWMVILLCMTACTILFVDGGEVIIDPTATPVVCENCTAIPTDVIENTATAEPTIPVVTETEIATATQILTETLTATPEATFTAPATVIPPTATKTSLPPTATKTAVPSPTSTQISEVYIVQPATPVFMQNFVHTTEGCNWQGVAGQVFDAAGKPITNLVVKVAGVWEGIPVSKVGITGMVSGTPYGPGSYEIVLGNKALNTIDQLQIQVFKTDSTPLTIPLSFSTSADCSQNLVMINFKTK